MQKIPRSRGSALFVVVDLELLVMEMPQVEYRDVVGFEEFFSVSDTGLVLSKRTGKLVKVNTSGRYAFITSRVGGRGGKSIYFKVHRAVAQAFIANPDQLPQVNHKDGNKQNNNVENLEWVSASQNSKHAWDSGLNSSKRRVKACGTNSRYEQGCRCDDCKKARSIHRRAKYLKNGN